VADARQVRHRTDLQLGLDTSDQVDRLLPRAAAGAVRDRDIAGMQGMELVDRLEQRGKPGVGLRGKKLEGDRRLAVVEQLVDSHEKLRRWRGGALDADARSRSPDRTDRPPGGSEIFIRLSGWIVTCPASQVKPFGCPDNRSAEPDP